MPTPTTREPRSFGPTAPTGERRSDAIWSLPPDLLADAVRRLRASVLIYALAYLPGGAAAGARGPGNTPGHVRRRAAFWFPPVLSILGAWPSRRSHPVNAAVRPRQAAHWARLRDSRQFWHCRGRIPGDHGADHGRVRHRRIRLVLGRHLGPALQRAGPDATTHGGGVAGALSPCAHHLRPWHGDGEERCPRSLPSSSSASYFPTWWSDHGMDRLSRGLWSR